MRKALPSRQYSEQCTAAEEDNDPGIPGKRSGKEMWTAGFRYRRKKMEAQDRAGSSQWTVAYVHCQ